CQRDAFGPEVTLRDCPPEHETGITLPPLEYLPRGPEGCVLSVRRDELLRQWGVRDPVRAGDALVLTPKQAGPYDALLVWFDQDKAVRIVARHRPRGKTNPAPEQLAKEVAAAWAEQIQRFGWPRR